MLMERESATPEVAAAVTAESRKVAIVGFWEITRDLAPYGDLSWQIWGCNHLFPYLGKGPDGQPRWTQWLDIHDPEWSEKFFKPEVWADMERWLRIDHGRPIYMQRHYSRYPSSVPYPRDEINARFGVTRIAFPKPGEKGGRIYARRNYYTNAVAYQLALAIHQGVTEIELYGADMRGDEEYATQRPCVEWWLGLAQGMGVKVAIPEVSGLLNSDGLDYGYDEDTNAWVEMRRVLESEVERASKGKDDALAAAQTFDGLRQGALDMIRRIDQKRRGGGVL